MIQKLITAPTFNALTLDEVKAHLREKTTDNDAYINDLMTAAQRKVEEEYDLGLTDGIWEMYLDEFPKKEIEIWKWPVTTPISVKYTDGNGVIQTITSTNYATDLVGKPARIYPISSYSWPDVKDTVNAVQVRFKTGFTSPETIPEDIKIAMLLIITDWFDNREDKGRRFTRVSEMILNKYKYR